MTGRRVPFLDVAAATAEVRAEQDAAIARVVDSGWYVLGPELERFEAAFAAAHGAAHAVGVGNGLDALRLTLVALGIGPGDEVVVPSHTFIATWLAVLATGARPVPVEPGDGFPTIGADAIAAAITARTVAVIPVHLYGVPADLDALTALCTRRGLALVADAAQAHGARWAGRSVGAYGSAATWSFYPAKNLGALGDGGAITTDDGDLARRLRRLRNYGSERKYHHAEQGTNSRLDEIQAAVLGVRLGRLAEWNARRARLATRYGTLLAGTGLGLPAVPDGAEPSWHLYVVRTPERDLLAGDLARAGVETLIHYPLPCHRQPALGADPLAMADLPWADRAAAEVLSLPLGPHLTDAEQVVVAEAIHASTTIRAVA